MFIMKPKMQTIVNRAYAVLLYIIYSNIYQVRIKAAR